MATLSKPLDRFYVWDSLSPSVKEVVISLGHTAETWAQVLEAPVELIPHDDLTATQKEGADLLGFGTSDVCDCWIHHYESDDWDELGEAGGKPKAKCPTGRRLKELSDLQLQLNQKCPRSALTI